MYNRSIKIVFCELDDISGPCRNQKLVPDQIDGRCIL